MESVDKVQQLKNQLESFLSRLEMMDPSNTSVEDIDNLIAIIEKMEANL